MFFTANLRSLAPLLQNKSISKFLVQTKSAHKVTCAPSYTSTVSKIKLSNLEPIRFKYVASLQFITCKEEKNPLTELEKKSFKRV